MPTPCAFGPLHLHCENGRSHATKPIFILREGSSLFQCVTQTAQLLTVASPEIRRFVYLLICNLRLIDFIKNYI